MKRILILPKKTSGIVDVRKEDYFIMNDITYLEEITNALQKGGKSPANYKFCQFEEKETIPYFINVKDKLSNGYSEFEVSRVKFKTLEMPEETKQSMINERHLTPLYADLATAKNSILELIIREWRGEETQELQKNQVIKRLDDVNGEIEGFDYKKYLNEIV